MFRQLYESNFRQQEDSWKKEKKRGKGNQTKVTFLPFHTNNGNRSIKNRKKTRRRAMALLGILELNSIIGKKAIDSCSC